MKTMKKFAALMMLLCALMICTIPALAANESGSDSDVTETVNVTARQPEATSQIRTTMMMGLVFIETVIIYALIVAILIIFVL